MTIVEYQAMATESAAKWLANLMAHTPEEKLTWKAATGDTSDTRTILDMAAECASANRAFAALLRGETPKSSPHDYPPVADGADAQKQVLDSARDLADTLRSCTDEVIGKTFETAFGPVPGSIVVSMGSGNMSYHIGQVAYIQRLYGDLDSYFVRG